MADVLSGPMLMSGRRFRIGRTERTSLRNDWSGSWHGNCVFLRAWISEWSFPTVPASTMPIMYAGSTASLPAQTAKPTHGEREEENVLRFEL